MRDGKASPPSSTAELRIYPDAAAALAKLKAAGFLLIVATNQPDVSRGALALADVENINAALASTLPLDEFKVCPHDDRDGCPCRKPRPGLLIEAAGRLGIDLAHSYMVGDRWRDVDAGTAAGCQAIVIERGHDERPPDRAPAFRTTTLEEAANWILNHSHCVSGHQT